MKANPTELKRNPVIWRGQFWHVLWFSLLFLCVAGLALYAVASSFPVSGGSEPREGAAAFHESVGIFIMQNIHGPCSWLYRLCNCKTAGLLVWLILATVLYGFKALIRRPRWVFTPRHQLGPNERERDQPH